jgi:hypothetical protein
MTNRLDLDEYQRGYHAGLDEGIKEGARRIMDAMDPTGLKVVSAVDRIEAVIQALSARVDAQNDAIRDLGAELRRLKGEQRAPRTSSKLVLVPKGDVRAET